MEMAELVQLVNNLREKQLNGGGLTDDEVREGIGYIVAIRRLRSGGKTFNNELPTAVSKKLEELF